MNFEDFYSHLQSQADQLQAAGDVASHRIVDFFDGLPSEQLTVVRDLFSSLSAVSDQQMRMMVTIVFGVVSGMLHARHGVCWGCTKDHDQVLREQMEKGA